ncbi:MAG: CBS domain-containing protein [Planctomycetota bacterium]
MQNRRLLADESVMYVRDIMTERPRTIRSDNQLNVAQSIFEMGDFRHLPVVDEQETLVGIVSRTDVLRAACSELAPNAEAGQREARLAGICIAEVMGQELLTTSPEVPVDEAARSMMRGRVNCLPVLEDDRLVGIVTSFDMLGLVGRTRVPSEA